MESNILGVYLICDACRTAGVARLMLTSSQQAVNGLRLPLDEHQRRIKDGEPLVQLRDGTAPTNHYALTKVFSEDIGRVCSGSSCPLVGLR